MSDKYRFDHRPPRHRKRHVYIVAGASFICITAIVVAVLILISQTTKVQSPVSGPKQTVGHVSGNNIGKTISIVEPDYSFLLPANWNQTANSDTAPPNTASWESIAAPDSARYLTIYVDNIPSTMAINRLLPVSAVGTGLTYGVLSDNCADFSFGDPTKPVAAKWQGVNFLCNLPQKVDNQTGTGSTEGINSVSVTGPKSGTHQYFILYIDRSAEPDYSILYAIINSFHAN